jgi:hypothetical protein
VPARSVNAHACINGVNKRLCKKIWELDDLANIEVAWRRERGERHTRPGPLDGGKKAVQEQKHLKEVVVKFLTHVVKLMRYPGAASYEVRWGQVSAGGGMPTAWNSLPLANVKTPATISGLTPGTTYVIQARAVTKAGYTDYGQPIAQMVILVLAGS